MSATEFTVDSLRNFRFYFSKFNELNDPCELTLSECTKDQLNSIRFQFLDPKGPNGIFCLCERMDNLHMWTQYADGHKGVVVEFETEDDKDYFSDLSKIVYTDTPPLYRDGMLVKDVIYSKSLDSEKELEWRVFGRNELRKINPAAVKSIIFGYRFPVGCSATTDPPEYLQEMYPKNTDKINAFVNLDRLFWENIMPDSVAFHQIIVEHGTYKLKLSPKWDRPARH